MKKFFSTVLALTFSTVIAYGETTKTDEQAMDQFKFGPQVGGSILSSKAGLFGEYALTRGLGIKSGLFYESNWFGMQDINEEKGKSAVVHAKYISLPAILRTYPGRSRQFCVFFGLQGRYLTGGEAAYVAVSDILSQGILSQDISAEDPGKFIAAIREQAEKLSPVKLKDKTQHPAPVRDVDLGWNVGFNYETSFGLIMGVEYDRPITSLMKCKQTWGAWTLQLDLGYNLAKAFLK